MAGIKKRWPTRYDLQAWWTFHKIQTATMEDFDNPEKIREWLDEYWHLSSIGVHRILFQLYQDFRVEYASPYMYGFQDPKDAAYVER
jgi:hypothetical protein